MNDIVGRAWAIAKKLRKEPAAIPPQVGGVYVAQGS